MTEPELSDFELWSSKVYAEIGDLGYAQGNITVVIDCAIPFRLGWDAKRAARALLRIDVADYRFLVAESERSYGY